MPVSMPVSAPADPDLAAVAAAWPRLPAAIRLGILAMVKAGTSAAAAPLGGPAAE